MSEEQRLKRTSILGQRTAGHGRLEGERTPTYRGELLHYREDFGTSMDDSVYEDAAQQQTDFDAGVVTAQDSIDTSRGDLRSDYNTQRDNLNAAQSGVDAASFDFQEGYIPTYSEHVASSLSDGSYTTVSVFDNGNLLAVHNLPVSTANDYINSVASSGGNAWNDEGRLGVDVQGYGAEIHHPLVYAEQAAIADYETQRENAYAKQGAIRDNAYSAFNTERDVANMQLGTAYETLESSYNNGTSALDASQGRLDDQIEANRVALDTVRNKYASKLANVSTTITEMFNARMNR